MLIMAVKTYIVPPEVSETPWCRGEAWILVKLESDTGIVGWGQAHTIRGREQAIIREIYNLFHILDGMHQVCARHFIRMASEVITSPGGSNETSAAASGIEIALWDMIGKDLNKPVHQLLGNSYHDRIGAYANCWSDVLRSPTEIANFAVKQVEMGFKAIKVYPFVHGNSLDDGVSCLDFVRNAVGPDVSIFVDMFSQMRNEELPDIIEALQAYGVTWFEDPVCATDLKALTQIRSQSNLPVVTGESLYLKHDFERLLEHQAADILNPDIAICGILNTMEIAAAADPFSVNVSIHNFNTMTIGLSAAMQVAMVIKNVNLIEYFPQFVLGSNSFSKFPVELGEDGLFSLPHEPGIGVTVDEKMIREMECEVFFDDQ